MQIFPDVTAAIGPADSSLLEASGLADVVSSGDNNIDAVLIGTRWDTTELTYAFPTDASYFTTPYEIRPGTNDDSYVDNFIAFNAEWQAAAIQVLEMFDAVSGLEFTAVDSSVQADIVFSQTSSSSVGTANGRFPTYGANEGHQWYQTSNYDESPERNTYTWATIIHETGHTVGLAHGHNPDSISPTFTGTVLDADINSLEFTQMTYKSFIGHTASYYTSERYGFASTLMMQDIAALQYLYGADYSTNNGDSVYTWSATTGEMFIDGAGQGAAGANRTFLTIWDGGGIDTYDLSARTENLEIDLAPGGWSKFSDTQLADLDRANTSPSDQKARANVFNAHLFEDNEASIIENAIGGSGNDTIAGNVAENSISGNAGNDMMSSGSGNDELYGGTGNDTLVGGEGADILDGGDDHDIADYSQSAAGVTVSLSAGTGVAGDAQGDTLDAIEEVAGSIHDDVLSGRSDASDTLRGSDGNDTIDGLSGNDALYGGDGNDWFTSSAGQDTIFGGNDNDTVDYGASDASVSVDLAVAAQSSGHAQGDMLYDIENIVGTDFNDTLLGSLGANSLSGGAGNDLLSGGAGADVLDGGQGFDTADYSGSASGVSISLQDDTASLGDAEGDQLTDIENLVGSADVDDLQGDGRRNDLDGGGGADSLYGNAGDDTLDGGSGNDILIAGTGDDVLTGGTGSDLFVFFNDDGFNTINDFDPALDRVRLNIDDASATPFDNLRISAQGSDTLVETDHGLTILFRNLLPSALDPSHFDVRNSADTSLSVAPVSDGPILGNLAFDAGTYVVGRTPAKLDVSGDATLTDADSDNFNNGALIVAFTSGRESIDRLSFDTSGSVAVAGGSVSVSGTEIGTVVPLNDGAGRDLIVTLNANANPATVQELLRALQYSIAGNDEPAANARTLSVTLIDGDGGSVTAGSIGITIIPINDAPTLTAVAENPTFTEPDTGPLAGVEMFSGVAASTVERAQTVTVLTLTVSNLSDGSDELVFIGGEALSLVDGTAVIPAVGNLTIGVSAGTAVLTLSGMTLTPAAVQTLVKETAYANASENPTPGSRILTWTSISDSGGTANGGIDTTALNLSSTVTVEGTNDDPAATGLPAGFAAVEDLPVDIDLSGMTLIDVDAGVSPIRLILTADAGTFESTSGGGVTVGGSGTILTLEGSIPALTTFLAATDAVKYTGAANANGTANLSVSVNDLGNNGTGGGGVIPVGTIAVTIAATNDAPVGTVTISGTAAQDQTLTASHTLTDVDGMGPVSYQWQRGGTDIADADAATYTLTQDDVGAVITVTASYTDLQGTAEQVTSAATTAVLNVNDAPGGTVTISGTAAQNQTLTAGDTLTDVDGMGPVSYQWQRGGTDITDANAATYTLTQDDVGAVITVTASYTDLQGTAEQVTSAATTAVLNVNDAPTGSVTISGTAAQNQTLTASHTLTDVDGMGPVSYQWQRGGTDITDADAATYTLTQDDVGAVITVTASYTDLQGTDEQVTSAATTAVLNVNDSPVGTVTISGTAAQNQTLTASHTLTDVDGMGPVSYQWQRGGTDITDADAATYTLTQDDVGAVITVTASYTDLQGTDEQVTSAATTAVLNVNDAPVGTVTISGTAEQNQTLTASDTLTDVDGMGPVSYQWQRGGTDITDADAATYTLTQDDVGAVITVTASYTDLQGTAEQVTSAATTAVLNVNDAPVGTVTISGTAEQNQTLTASDTLTDVDGMGPVSYQWQRGGTDITDADAATYTLTQDDVGAVITVTASYTDLQGTAEQVTSAATTAVLNVNDAPVSVADLLAATLEDTAMTYAASDFLANDSDRDGDALSIASVSDSIGGTARLNSDGSVTFDPIANFNGAAQFSYMATDGTDTSAPAIASLTVTAVDDAPARAANDAFTTDEMTPIGAGLSLWDDNGSDPDIAPETGAPRRITAVAGLTSNVGKQMLLASGALVTVMADGTFDYDPNGVFEALAGPLSGAPSSAVDSFDYTLNDADTATVTVTVTGLDGPNDIITGDPQGNTLQGGVGDDNLFGGGGDDLMKGGSGNNLLDGGTGDDDLRGHRGDDVMFGKDGDDRIAAGKGNDHLFGGNGNDMLFGRAGDDSLFGGSGNDTLYGGPGDDSLFGKADDDALFGQLGDDMLKGGRGRDILFGGKGDDSLFGGNGRDELYGGDGRDRLVGGGGNDRMTGGNGRDVFVFESAGAGRDKVLGFEDGRDMLDFAGRLSADLDELSLTGNGSSRVVLSLGNDIVILRSDGAMTIDAEDFVLL